VQDGLLAATLSFGGGVVLLAVIVVFRSSTRSALWHGIPALLRSGDLRWWHLLGGLGGATLVAGQGLAVPVLGVALVTVVMVAGTTAMSLVVDRSGIGPGVPRPVTTRRVLAAVFTTVAVAIAVSGRLAHGDVVWWAIVLVLVGGAFVAVQPALNGTIALRSGDALAATAVNFAVGFAALAIALLVEHAAGHAWAPPPMPWEQPWLWLGGPIGVLFIALASIVVKPLGVLLFGLLNIAGQLTGAMVADLFFPTPGTVVTWQLVGGVLLTGVAITWAARPPRRRAAPAAS